MKTTDGNNAPQSGLPLPPSSEGPKSPPSSPPRALPEGLDLEAARENCTHPNAMMICPDCEPSRAPLGEVGGPEVPPVAPRLDPACGFCCEQEDVGEDGACRCACHASTPDLEYRAALRVCVEALKQIRLRIAVWEGGDQKALESGLKALEAPKPEAPARKLEWGLSERQDAINILRQVCADHGDNDWPDDLHLGDVIEKHLWRNLAAPEAPGRREALISLLLGFVGVPNAGRYDPYYLDAANRVDKFLETRPAPDASPVVGAAPLAWTKEKPARDGWYWYRVPGQSKQSIDLVQLFTGSPCWHSAERMAWVPITWDLEWAGPIAEPVDAPAPLVKGAQS